MQKLTKIVQIEEVKVHIFWETLQILMKFLGKMLTYDIKSDQKTKLYSLQTVTFFWNIFLGLWCEFLFLNETLILVFAELEIFHSIL